MQFPISSIDLPQQVPSSIGYTKNTPNKRLPTKKSMSSKPLFATITTPSKKQKLKLSKIYEHSDDDEIDLKADKSDDDDDNENDPSAKKSKFDFMIGQYNTPQSSEPFLRPKSKKTSSIRVDKTMETVKKNLRNDYTYDNNWLEWVSYKNLHSKEVNAEIGKVLQKEYNEEFKMVKCKRVPKLIKKASEPN